MNKIKNKKSLKEITVCDETVLTMNMTTSGIRFKQALIEAGIDNPSLIRKLIIIGKLTYIDCWDISEIMGKTLLELDLERASVENGVNCLASGDKYFEQLTSFILPALFDETIIYFESCPCLSSITIHPDNPLYAGEDGVLYNKDKTELVFFPLGKQGDYFVPASVKYLEKEFAFNCPDLSSFTVHSDNLDYSSEDGVLYNKDKTILILYPGKRQGNLFIPASVTEIGSDAFHYSSELISINVHPDNPNFSSENGVLFNKDKTKLLMYPRGRQGDYIIPDSVVDAGFKRCRGLTSIIITKTIVEIGNFAFIDDCPALTSITVHPDNPNYSSIDGVLFNKDKTKLILCPEGKKGDYVIPDSVFEIGSCAFSNCDGLLSIIISNSVSKIGGSAFSWCNGLTSITIPKSVVEIEEDNNRITAFIDDCPTLTSITVHPDNPNYSSIDGVLFNKGKTELLFYPKGRKGDYIIPDSVVEIRKGAFNYCDLTSITIPDSVVKIGSFAFSDNKNLTSFVFSKSIRQISMFAFWGCINLASVSIPDSVREIESYAFSECYNLKVVTISKSVVYIAEDAFERCPAVFMVHPENPVYKSENGKLTKKVN